MLLTAAVAAPVLLAFNLSPSPTFLNQALANGLWGACIALLAPASLYDRLNDAVRSSALLIAALSLLGVCLIVPVLRSHLPQAIALSMLGTLACASLVVCCGACVALQREPISLVASFLWGLLAAGMLSAAISMIQVFAPDWPSGDLIARSGFSGRAVGNLRQPNHLASLLLWSTIAAVGLLELKRLSLWACILIGALLTFCVVLSGSRTGALGLLVLAVWGVCDGRLSMSTRRLLIAAPLLYALAWAGMWAWAHVGGHVFGAEGRMSLNSGGDISSSRFAIWLNAWQIVLREPLLGVGFGEFNLAWTLTQLPDRPVAFFDHTHNLPLQFAVELGLPLASAVLVLLLMALQAARRRSWRAVGDQGIAQRTAFMLVLMISLHSLLEYPLWYAYFLMPTAFAWGFALALTGAEQPAVTAVASQRRLTWAMTALGLTMTLGAAASVLDYYQVAVIYEPPANAPPLEDRVARGQRSPLFAHHADYAAATAFGEARAPLQPSQVLAFQRAPHHLLDVRLMIAWSQALAEQGEVDKARWLAARIREFRNPASDEFFEPCARSAQVEQVFQCQAPQRRHDWREFAEH